MDKKSTDNSSEKKKEKSDPTDKDKKRARVRSRIDEARDLMSRFKQKKPDQVDGPLNSETVGCSAEYKGDNIETKFCQMAEYGNQISPHPSNLNSEVRGTDNVICVQDEHQITRNSFHRMEQDMQLPPSMIQNMMEQDVPLDLTMNANRNTMPIPNRSSSQINNLQMLADVAALEHAFLHRSNLLNSSNNSNWMQTRLTITYTDQDQCKTVNDNEEKEQESPLKETENMAQETSIIQSQVPHSGMPQNQYENDMPLIRNQTSLLAQSQPESNCQRSNDSSPEITFMSPSVENLIRGQEKRSTPINKVKSPPVKYEAPSENRPTPSTLLPIPPDLPPLITFREYERQRKLRMERNTASCIIFPPRLANREFPPMPNAFPVPGCSSWNEREPEQQARNEGSSLTSVNSFPHMANVDFFPMLHPMSMQLPANQAMPSLAGHSVYEHVRESRREDNSFVLINSSLRASVLQRGVAGEDVNMHRQEISSPYHAIYQENGRPNSLPVYPNTPAQRQLLEYARPHAGFLPGHMQYTAAGGLTAQRVDPMTNYLHSLYSSGAREHLANERHERRSVNPIEPHQLELYRRFPGHPQRGSLHQFGLRAPAGPRRTALSKQDLRLRQLAKEHLKWLAAQSSPNSRPSLRGASRSANAANSRPSRRGASRSANAANSRPSLRGASRSANAANSRPSLRGTSRSANALNRPSESPRVPAYPQQPSHQFVPQQHLYRPIVQQRERFPHPLPALVAQHEQNLRQQLELQMIVRALEEAARSSRH